MAILAIDLGGTKLAIALFSEAGQILSKDVVALDRRVGDEVGHLIQYHVKKYRDQEGANLKAIGVSVPGIARIQSGTVWAPNIDGWDDYPLRDQIKKVSKNVPVYIDSDRACSILGEHWKGNARSCRDAIFLSVGTGIGAGILTEGNILRGAHDIAGAVGWMALKKPFEKKYASCGCFEYYASGEGIAKLTMEMLRGDDHYDGILKRIAPERMSAQDVFAAYESGDPLAAKVVAECIEFWGMATANLVSIFNPEKIIFGGGVFGPAVKFIPKIKNEAGKWAQPISITKVTFEQSGLSGDAAIYGAGFLALKHIQHT